MKSAGIVAKLGNPEAIALSSDVAEWLKQRGIEAYGDSELCKRIDTIRNVSREDISKKVDFIVVLGGDGTMLYAARLVGGAKIPILGVNMGGLGFLTAIKVEEVFKNLERVLDGNFETEERMMLSVEVRRGSRNFDYLVLNDAAIKSKIARLCSLEATIDNEFVTTYRADGLIVATPTGSTGYSLSASGPILYPTIHSIIVAPICPFNLTNRPVVVPDWMVVELRVTEDCSSVELTLDGQIDMPLNPGDLVKVKRAEASVYLVKCEGKGYFDILRERLMWEKKS